MSAKGEIKILSTPQYLQLQIIKELRPKIVTAFNKSVPLIKSFVVNHIKSVVNTDFSFRSMQNGELRAEMGFEDGKKIVDAITRELLQELEVKIDNSSFDRNGIDISLGVRFIDTDFVGILNMPEASYISVSERGVSKVKWAEWLILEGYSVVVRDFYIDYNLTIEESRRSRSGLALMRPDKRQNYRVPMGFAGTKDNNFITRAFEKSEVVIADKISEIFMGAIK